MIYLQLVKSILTHTQYFCLESMIFMPPCSTSASMEGNAFHPGVQTRCLSDAKSFSLADANEKPQIGLDDTWEV